MIDSQRGEGEVAIVGLVTFVVLLIATVSLWGCPRYSVYEQRLTGEAELARASYNRQVAVNEANAKMEAAKLLAQAEVERAKGVAQANAIIGEGLKGHEDYLRYLWITGLQNSNREVIYVPTEANLPILEATRSTNPVKVNTPTP